MERWKTPRIEETKNIRNANFPKDGVGRTYHTFTREGDVCNRVVTVGSHGRAKMISTLLDDVKKHVVSDRGFVTYTGSLRGTPVTVVATGMGLPMVDMMVREVNACQAGGMLFLRLGTCGTPNRKVPIGSVTVNNKCVIISRNYDGFSQPDSPSNGEKQTEKYYYVSKPIMADKDLTDSLERELRKRLDSPVVVGTGATCDSFYGSQGRRDSWFADHNDKLIDEFMEKYPEAVTLEMETGHLLHLARISRRHKIRAGGCAIVLAQRRSNGFLAKDKIKLMERESAIAVLEALITTKLSDHDETAAPPLEKGAQLKYYAAKIARVSQEKGFSGGMSLAKVAKVALAFGALAAGLLAFKWSSSVHEKRN